MPGETSEYCEQGKSSHGEFLGWPVRGEMPRGRMVMKEAAELAVATVKPRADHLRLDPGEIAIVRRSR